MLRIRLARGGAKKRPYYFIVVADSHAPRDGRFIEKVGAYNPLLKRDDPQRVTLNLESIQTWIGKGAQPSDRVQRFLAAEGVGTWTHGNNPQRGEPGKKAKERAEERAQKAADRAAQPAPAPAPAPEPEAAADPEAVAEEPPVEAAAEAPAAEDAPAEAPPEEPEPVEAAAEDAPVEAATEDEKAS